MNVVCYVYKAWCTQSTPNCTQQQSADSKERDPVRKINGLLQNVSFQLTLDELIGHK
jgi:hypothetical protein